MAIIGMSFKSFEGKRHPQEVKAEIKVNSVPRINEVKVSPKYIHLTHVLNFCFLILDS